MKKRPKPAPIKLKSFDPETGEKHDGHETVSPDHFKPKGERLFSPDTQRDILAGLHPSLKWPAENPCPVNEGQTIEVTPRVSIRIERIGRTKKGMHAARYVVIDDRPTLPRRTTPMHEPPELDDQGFPVKHTPSAIAAATVDGNYTQSPDQAVPDVADEVGIEYRRALSARSRSKRAKERPEEEAQEIARRLNTETRELAKRAVKNGVDPALALAPIAALIAEAHAQMGEQAQVA